MTTSGAKRVRARTPLPSDALVFTIRKCGRTRCSEEQKKRDNKQTENSTKSNGERSY